LSLGFLGPIASDRRSTARSVSCTVVSPPTYSSPLTIRAWSTEQWWKLIVIRLYNILCTSHGSHRYYFFVQKLIRLFFFFLVSSPKDKFTQLMSYIFTLHNPVFHLLVVRFDDTEYFSQYFTLMRLHTIIFILTRGSKICVHFIEY